MRFGSRGRPGVHRTLSAGQVFTEPVGSVHRGVAEPDGVATIASYAGIPEMPLSEPES